MNDGATSRYPLTDFEGCGELVSFSGRGNPRPFARLIRSGHVRATPLHETLSETPRRGWTPRALLVLGSWTYKPAYELRIPPTL